MLSRDPSWFRLGLRRLSRCVILHGSQSSSVSSNKCCLDRMLPKAVCGQFVASGDQLDSRHLVYRFLSIVLRTSCSEFPSSLMPSTSDLVNSVSISSLSCLRCRPDTHQKCNPGRAGISRLPLNERGLYYHTCEVKMDGAQRIGAVSAFSTG